MEVITFGMATVHSLPYMVFFVSVLSYYGAVQTTPYNPYLCNIDVIESKIRKILIFSYLHRIHIATFLPFREYRINNQLRMSGTVIEGYCRPSNQSIADTMRMLLPSTLKSRVMVKAMRVNLSQRKTEEALMSESVSRLKVFSPSIS